MTSGATIVLGLSTGLLAAPWICDLSKSQSFSLWMPWKLIGIKALNWKYKHDAFRYQGSLTPPVVSGIQLQKAWEQISNFTEVKNKKVLKQAEHKWKFKDNKLK